MNETSMSLGMNVNAGASIMIRLRHPRDKNRFLEWHDILGTMCHELAHMQIGPHNAAFYKLWDELSDEVERAGKASFYNPSSSLSSGFMTNGVKLGGSNVKSGQPLRESIAEAAAKRQKTGSLSVGSGQKLGGSLTGKKLKSSQLRDLVARAAERRLVDDLWCPTQSADIDPNMAMPTTSHPVSSSSSSFSPSSSSGGSLWDCSVCTEPNPAASSVCSYCGIDRWSSYSQNDNDDQPATKRSASSSSSSSNHENKSSYCQPCAPAIRSNSSVKNDRVWECLTCTFINEYTSTAPTYGATTGSGKPAYVCIICGHQEEEESLKEDGDTANGSWICEQCTYRNTAGDRCEVCDCSHRQPTSSSPSSSLQHHPPIIDLTASSQ
jgi:DNA-dependent metalloprotease WSS1